MYYAELGAFLTRDPLPQNGEPEVLYDNNDFGRWLDMMRNLYGYASDNPIRQTDPTGEEGMDSVCQQKRMCTGVYVNQAPKGVCPPGHMPITRTTKQKGVIILTEDLCLKDCDPLGDCPAGLRCKVGDSVLTIGDRVTTSTTCRCQ